MRVGITSRIDVDTALNVVKEIVSYLNSRGIEVVVDERILKSTSSTLPASDLSKSEMDLLIVVGGDGTLLHTLQRLKDVPPVLTVRVARYGFLMEVEPHEFKYYFEKLLLGEYHVAKKMRLYGKLDDRSLPPVLNEYTILSAEGKVIKIDVERNGEEVLTFLGDGIIIAPTTGSTGYSLSAGGPIIDEDLDAIVITPINPMQLYVRPIVFSSESRIVVRVRGRPYSACLFVDGQLKIPVKPESVLEVFKGDFVRFIRFKRNFYEKILRRLEVL